MIGALTGAAAGATVGFLSGDDECQPGSWCILTYTAEEKAAMLGLTSIIPGGIVGTLLGTSKKTITINGDQLTYTNSRDQLRTYSLINE